MAVNVFSRLMSVEPIRNKKKAEVQRALETIFEKTGIEPQTLYSDIEGALTSNAIHNFCCRKVALFVRAN